jgi:MFS family permease
MAERWLPAWALASVGFGGASLVVPLYVVELGGSALDLGVLFATASLVGVPGSLVFGSLADRTGKRRVFVLAAMAVAVLTTLAIPLLDRVSLVVVANALLWFGYSAALPVLTLLVIAGEPESRWSTRVAHLNERQGIGWALGLALGFVVTAGVSVFADPITGQRWVLFACAAAAATGTVLGVRTLPPDPRPGEEPSPRRLRRRIRGVGFGIRNAAFPFTPSRFDARRLHPRRFVERFTPRLATYFGGVLLAFTGFGVFFAPLPAYLSTTGYGSSATFALYLLLNASGAAFYGRAALLAERYEPAPVHAGALLARVVAFPVVAGIGTAAGGTILGIGLIAVVFAVIGLSWAAIAVTAATLVTALSPPSIRGEALGVYGALVAVGGGLGGLLGGSLAGVGYLVAFGTAGALVLLGAAVVLAVSRQASPAPAPNTEPVD